MREVRAQEPLADFVPQELHAHPLKSQQPRGRKKNQTQPLLRTGLVQRCTFPSGCREIIAEIYPQIHWERRGDRKEKPSLAVLPPSSGGAATGVYERASGVVVPLPARAARHPPASAVRRNESCLGQPAGVGGYELQLRAVQALQIRQQRRPQLQVRVHHAHHHSLQGRRANANAAQGKRLDGMVGISSSFFFFSFLLYHLSPANTCTYDSKQVQCCNR